MARSRGLASVLLVLFSPIVSSWDITFHSNTDCSKGGYSVTYTGNDTDSFSACVRAGDAHSDMECYKQDPAGAQSPCDGPMTSAPGSLWYGKYSDCCVGYSNDCNSDTCDFHGDQCLWTDGMPGATSDTVTFKCKLMADPWVKK